VVKYGIKKNNKRVVVTIRHSISLFPFKFNQFVKTDFANGEAISENIIALGIQYYNDSIQSAFDMHSFQTTTLLSEHLLKKISNISCRSGGW
jgi:hypothetical protein